MGGGGAGGSSGAPNLMPTKLSETGLFKSINPEMLGDGVFAFEPAYQLWSDSATKRRWAYLPPGAQITTNGTANGMEYWEYPPGFKLWKEFSRDGKRIETRLLLKKGGLADWYMVAFKWNDDGSDAIATPTGEMNAMGTNHDIPGEEGCKGCHTSMYDNALGFTALQLSHDKPNSLNLTQVVAMGWLTQAPATPFALPGTEAEKQALGYLHANCGMCHNSRGKVYTTVADLDLWAHLGQLQSVQQTRAYLSMVCDEWPGPGGAGSPITGCTAGHATGAARVSEVSELAKRVVPGNAEMSAMHELMNLRSAAVDMRQMPPLGTEMVDPTGLATVDAWINALPAQ